MACPSPDTLVDYAEGAGDDAARMHIEQHCAECELCRAALVALADSGDGNALGIGTRVAERYTIEAPLGSGASAEVWLARDTKLARRVALKVLHARVADMPDAGARMMREARALAQLAHPYVLGIYDSGWHGERPFLAMETAPGGTLASWRDTEVRTWRDTVARFIEAGEGLAAAHATGIIHRDFKATNVLIGADGRARVCDFGLASAPQEAPGIGAFDAALTLTQSGAVMGTPAYMAPEQLLGGAADTLSDQFSFFVALFEALSHTRPFPLTGVAGTLAAMRAGPGPCAGPRALQQIVRRGLAFEAGKRHPDMGAAVTALKRVLARQRRLRTGAAALVVLGVLAVVSWRVLDDRACTHGARELARSFNATHVDRLQQAYAGSPEAAALWPSLQARIDAFRTGWTETWQHVCVDTRVARTSDQATLSLRIECLRRAAEQMRVATDVLSDKGPSASLVAADVLDGAPDAKDCLRVSETSPVAWMPRVEGVYAAALDEIQVLRSVQDDAAAEKKALAVLADARAKGAASLETETLTQLALINYALQRYDQTDIMLKDAALLAEAQGLDMLRMAALSARGSVLGARLRQFTRAHELLDSAEAIARRFEPDAPLDDILYARATVLNHEGRRAEAEQQFRRSLAIQRELGRAHKPMYLETLLGLARSVLWQGHAHAAAEAYEEALRETRRRMGEQHKVTQRAFHDLGRAYEESGQLEKASAALQQAVALAPVSHFEEGIVSRAYQLHVRHLRGEDPRAELRALLAQSKDPGHRTTISRMIAEQAFNLGDWDTARSAADALLLLPSLSAVQKLRVSCLRAAIDRALGAHDLAYARYEKAFLEAPAIEPREKACAAAGLALTHAGKPDAAKWITETLTLTDGVDTRVARVQRASVLSVRALPGDREEGLRLLAEAEGRDVEAARRLLNLKQ